MVSEAGSLVIRCAKVESGRLEELKGCYQVEEEESYSTRVSVTSVKLAQTTCVSISLSLSEESMLNDLNLQKHLRQSVQTLLERSTRVKSC